MWVCFNDGFVSAVETSDGGLKIRARNRKHLETLFPGKDILETKGTDYRFRVFVTKQEFADLLVKRVNEISYGNFKDSVKDHRLHDLYADFWHLHWDYQCELYDKPGKAVRK